MATHPERPKAVVQFGNRAGAVVLPVKEETDALQTIRKNRSLLAYCKNIMMVGASPPPVIGLVWWVIRAPCKVLSQ